MVSDLKTNVDPQKVLFLGYPNSGKTALINLLLEKNLDKSFNLFPTRRKKVRKVSFENRSFFLWEIARSPRLQGARAVHLLDADELIYLIDCQASHYSLLFIEYFSQILDKLSSEKVKQSLGPKFRISILLHKADPDLRKTIELRDHIKFLYHKLQDLHIPFEHEVCETSIFHFNPIISKPLFEGFSSIGNLLWRLLSNRLS